MTLRQHAYQSVAQLGSGRRCLDESLELIEKGIVGERKK
jgi:hypothetical protein